MPASGTDSSPPRKATDREDADRVIAFERDLRRRSSHREQHFRAGAALFRDELPRVWDANVVHLTATTGTLVAAELVAEAERLQDGLAHRKVIVDDDELGADLAPGMRALGWQVRPMGIMVHRRPLDRPPDRRLAREITLDELLAVRAQALRAEPYGGDPETVRQILAADRALAGPGRARHLGGPARGDLACFLTLYSDGPTALLQSMVTLGSARGRGLARAAMALGVELAAAHGHTLTGLATVDEVPWLRAVYTRMGFDLVGRWWTFVRLPGVGSERPRTVSSGAR